MEELVGVYFVAIVAGFLVTMFAGNSASQSCRVYGFSLWSFFGYGLIITLSLSSMGYGIFNLLSYFFG